MDAGIAEPDPGERRGEHHPFACLEVAGMIDGPAEPAAEKLERLGSPRCR